MITATTMTYMLPILSAILAPLVTGVFGYAIAKARHKHETKKQEQNSYVLRQKQLAEEQQAFLTEQNQFRQEMREELKRVKDSLLIEQKRNLNLEEEIREWQKKYNDLLTENQNLQLQITELKIKLSLLSHEEKSEDSESSENSEQGDESND